MAQRIYVGPNIGCKLQSDVGMKGVLIVAMSMVLSQWAVLAQNLVPNPDFSLVNGCPGEYKPPCDGQFTCIQFWQTCTIRPPWHFHVCGTGQLGIPYQGFNYQEAKKGDGFMGLHVIGVDDYSQRSMAQCELLDSLQQGVDYYIQFYVNRKELLNGIETYYDAIGAFFSDTSYYVHAEYNKPLPVPPPDIWASDIIKDTVGWELVSGCYKAKGGEKFMVIGNMKHYHELKKESGDGAGTVVFYYIDDVGVYGFDPLPDTLYLCPDDTITLTATFPNSEILWQGSVHSSQFSISQSGRVYVEAHMENCVLRDVVEVIQLPPPFELKHSIMICDGVPVELNSSIPGIPCWNDGICTSSRNVDQSGNFIATMTNSCGIYSEIFEVESFSCDCPVYVPTGFSPNNDGINDVFVPHIGCALELRDIRFEVFDRWGNILYSEHGIYLNGWDGTLNGEPLGTGLYTWTFSFKSVPYQQDEKMYNLSGGVQLIR